MSDQDEYDDRFDDIIAANVQKRRAGTSGAGSVVAAAMLGLGEVLEPDKTSVDMEEVQPADPDDDTLLDLDFGDLPEL